MHSLAGMHPFLHSRIAESWKYRSLRSSDIDRYDWSLYLLRNPDCTTSDWERPIREGTVPSWSCVIACRYWRLYLDIGTFLVCAPFAAQTFTVFVIVDQHPVLITTNQPSNS